VVQIREELVLAQKKLVQIFQHKERVEDQAEYLMNDRGSAMSQKKYRESIEEFLK
jgi:hypothetical protein